jgi:hypothetical protein
VMAGGTGAALAANGSIPQPIRSTLHDLGIPVTAPAVHHDLGQHAAPAPAAGGPAPQVGKSTTTAPRQTSGGAPPPPHPSATAAGSGVGDLQATGAPSSDGRPATAQPSGSYSPAPAAEYESSARTTPSTATRSSTATTSDSVSTSPGWPRTGGGESTFAGGTPTSGSRYPATDSSNDVYTASDRDERPG